MMNFRTANSKMTFLWSFVLVLIIAGIITLFFFFSGAQRDSITEVNQIYTNAALTLDAQRLTLEANFITATPSAAPPISPTATSTLYPSPTLGGFATSTSPVATTCDNSIYITDVTIPDNTVVNPGQAFTKTWRLSNNGTCPWTATYQITHISGDSMSGKSTAIGQLVAPGRTADVSVALIAPATGGTITGVWRLSNDKAQMFGQTVTVVIKIGGGTGTVTVTPTKTSTGVAVATFTPSSSPTTVPLATTVVPSDTPVPTNTPVPTDTPVTPAVQ